jgi:hypothetical protein
MINEIQADTQKGFVVEQALKVARKMAEKREIGRKAASDTTLQDILGELGSEQLQGHITAFERAVASRGEAEARQAGENDLSEEALLAQLDDGAVRDFAKAQRRFVGRYEARVAQVRRRWMELDIYRARVSSMDGGELLHALEEHDFEPEDRT